MLEAVRPAFKKPVQQKRPPRIRVPNRERALFTVEKHKFVGVVHRISLTGGSVVHKERPFPSSTLATMELRTVYGKVTAHIELLQMGADGLGGAQAFRFLSVDEIIQKRLSVSITQMQSAGFSDIDAGWCALTNPAYQRLRKLRDGIESFLQMVTGRRMRAKS